MQEYGFSLTRTFPYKSRIVDPVLIGRILVSGNPYSCIFYAVDCLALFTNVKISFLLVGAIKYGCCAHMSRNYLKNIPTVALQVFRTFWVSVSDRVVPYISCLYNKTHLK